MLTSLILIFASIHSGALDSLVSKIIEKKVKEYPTLIPNNVNTPKLRFKEADFPKIHLNEVSKNIGDQGCLQSLVESLTGKATRWWGTHKSRLHIWMTKSTYFVKRFGGQKLTTQADINTFHPGDDPTKHIELCQKEWK